VIAAAILGFALIPLSVHAERNPARGLPLRWRYHALFETAWRNALISGNALLLTGVFWVVLFAGAELMNSIGIDFVLTLIKQEIFAIPVTGIVFGAAFALGLARLSAITTIRRFSLSVCAWLLPLTLLFSVMWVVLLPFTGLEPLFNTHDASFILLWFVALSVFFANAAYQDGGGEEPYGRALGRLLEYAWPCTVALAAIAWWAMGLRITQYGWTEQRVWGVFVLVQATLYAVGYTSSALRHCKGWLQNIGLTNIVTALVMCAGLLLLLSPLADPRRIAVDSQMARLRNMDRASDNFDYSYLRWRAGRYGQDALKQLAAGIEHKDRDAIASKAKQILAQTSRHAAYEDNDDSPKKLSLQEIRPRFHVLGSTAPDDALLQTIQGDRHGNDCLEVERQCAIWMIDLNGDGAQDAIVLTEQPEYRAGYAVLYQRLASGQYQYGGEIRFDRDLDKLKAAIKSGKAHTIEPLYRDLSINGQRITVEPDNGD
ncbi:MAG: DUF4153 domain-containing protein, partial [Gallionellaceae bacterium]|jgi:hypothetical protein|nr:DUF4153 domain-containing protein [Gallionellaceae bacterium]